MAEVFNQAKCRKIKKIFAEVSITAKPFFISCGFTVVKEQSVNCRGVYLTNFIMEYLSDC
jgi:putative acetyltransferase